MRYCRLRRDRWSKDIGRRGSRRIDWGSKSLVDRLLVRQCSRRKVVDAGQRVEARY